MYVKTLPYIVLCPFPIRLFRDIIICNNSSIPYLNCKTFYEFLPHLVYILYPRPYETFWISTFHEDARQSPINIPYLQAIRCIELFVKSQSIIGRTYICSICYMYDAQKTNRINGLFHLGNVFT